MHETNFNMDNENIYDKYINVSIEKTREICNSQHQTQSLPSGSCSQTNNLLSDSYLGRTCDAYFCISS